MNIIAIDQSNIDSEHICCAIGNDADNKTRALTKKTWMKAAFRDGLVFKRLDARGKVFIEYMPVEHVWKPLIGTNYFVVNCLWVSGQFKGQGYAAALLDECINDAKSQHKDGIAVVTGTKVKPFLTDKKFYLKYGFETVDSAAPYFELLALKLNRKAPVPQFTAAAKNGICAVSGAEKGLTIVYSNQCVFMESYVPQLCHAATELGIPAKLVKLSSAHEAQMLGSPFGTLGIYRDGTFLTHELMTPAKIKKILETT